MTILDYSISLNSVKQFLVVSGVVDEIIFRKIKKSIPVGKRLIVVVVVQMNHLLNQWHLTGQSSWQPLGQTR